MEDGLPVMYQRIFLFLASKLGISEKVDQNLIKRFRKHLPEWDQIIDKSFCVIRRRENLKN